MILYFSDRDLNIIGSAHTNLRDGYIIVEDKKTEDVDVGTPTFTAKIIYKTVEDRINLKNIIKAGNYLLRYEGNNSKKTQFEITDSTDFYTIIESEDDPDSQTIYLYAEGGGLDLLNDLTVSSGSTDAQPAGYYFEQTLSGTDFVIRNDRSRTDQKALTWDSKDTLIARLKSIASAFDVEFKMGFDINGFKITRKWVDIAPTIGEETAELLHSNINVNKITVKESIANIATALYATGKDINLNDYTPSEKVQELLDSNGMELSTFPDGVYLISNPGFLRWRSKGREDRHIFKSFSTEDTSQETLCINAIDELKKRIEPEINYTVDIVELPANSKIGDRVNIVDRDGEIYTSGRILKLETSIITGKRTATLGEYKIKGSGISDTVRDLAARFREIAKNRNLYVWVAYADDRLGTNITRIYAGQAYIGYLENQPVPLTDDSQLIDKVEEFHFQSMDSGVVKDILQQYYVDFDGSVIDPETDIPEEAWTDTITFDDWQTNTAIYTRQIVEMEVETAPGYDPKTIITATTPINAKVLNVTAHKIFADEARIGNLEAEAITVEDLTVKGTGKLAEAYIDIALIEDASIDNAKIGDLDAEKIVSGQLSADVMSANIFNAINGTFGTIDVSRLVYTDPATAKKYFITFDEETGEAVKSLIPADGLIEPLTIVADLIQTGAITTNKLSVGQYMQFISEKQGGRFLQEQPGTSYPWNNGVNWYLRTDKDYIYELQEGKTFDENKTYFKGPSYSESIVQPTMITWGNGENWYIRTTTSDGYYRYIEQKDQELDPEETYYIKNGVPIIILGSAGSAYKLSVSNGGLEFYQNVKNEDVISGIAEPVAYIYNQKLRIAKTVVLDEMQVGDNKWSWKYDSRDDSLYLKWIGGDI